MEVVACANPDIHHPLPPPPPGGNHYRDHPGPEWYPYKLDQHISYLTLKDKSGNEVAAKYLHMGLHQGEPMLLGTMGYDRPVHSQPLHALPFQAPSPSCLILPSFQTLTHPFDPHIERALNAMGDLGIQAEVYRLRRIVHRQQEALHRRYVLQEEDRQLRQRWAGVYDLEQGLEQEEASIKQHLKDAQVFLHLEAHCSVDREPGEVPSTMHYTELTGRVAKYDKRAHNGSSAQRGLATISSINRGRRPTRPCGYCLQDGHFKGNCPVPHIKCDQLQCKVDPHHYCFCPLIACPHHRLASSSSCITPYEEEAALTDLLYDEEGSF